MVTVRVFCAICFSLVSCNQHLSGSGEKVTRSKNAIRAMWKTFRVAEDISKQPPPTTMRELVDWVAEGAGRRHGNIYIDHTAKTIVDVCGRNIVLVTKDDPLVALGSAGADGVWRGGQGDDIVVARKDVIGKRL